MIEKIHAILFKIWVIFSGILAIVSISFIFVYIFINGYKSITLEFIFSNPKGIPIGAEGGIFPAIVGSLLLMIIACVFASILAISTAIYVVFYCKSKKLESIVHVVIQCMAGVPSIVIGLFGYTLMVVNLKMGRSLLSSGLTLGVMIFPFIQVRVEKTFREFSKSTLDSSYALGISKLYTLTRLVLPHCMSEVVSAVTLAGGFAMGAAAPIILTGAVIFAPIPKSPLSPVMALPFHLYILTGEGISMEKAYGTALVLIVLLFIINIFSITLTLWKKGVNR